MVLRWHQTVGGIAFRGYWQLLGDFPIHQQILSLGETLSPVWNAFFKWRESEVVPPLLKTANIQGYFRNFDNSFQPDDDAW